MNAASFQVGERVRTDGESDMVPDGSIGEIIALNLDVPDLGPLMTIRFDDPWEAGPEEHTFSEDEIELSPQESI